MSDVLGIFVEKKKALGLNPPIPHCLHQGVDGPFFAHMSIFVLQIGKFATFVGSKTRDL